MSFTLPAPQFTGVVPNNLIIEPLGGPQDISALLGHFPDAVYNKAPSSHFYRFMAVLLGPAGVGYLRSLFQRARMQFEANGLSLDDLDAFLGNPLGFARLLEEQYDVDPEGQYTKDQWDAVRARDAGFRSRAMDFLGGVRLGPTVEGMRLAAKGGLGHDVEIVENYKYLYDLHSDQPQGYRYYGSTYSTEEFVVVPRRDTSRSAVQTITVPGSATQGAFALQWGGTQSLGKSRGTWVNGTSYAVNDVVLRTGVYYLCTQATSSQDPSTDTTHTFWTTQVSILSSSVQYNAPAQTDFATPSVVGLQQALQAMAPIGVGNVIVTGGPGALNPYTVTFTGALAGQAVPTLVPVYSTVQDSGNNPLTVSVVTTTGGVDPSQEVATIAPADVHSLQVALDKLRPVPTLPNVNTGSGTRSPQPWQSVSASSQYHQVLRFVTGNTNIPWPTPDSNGVHWIQAGVESEAPRAYADLKHNYHSFHNPTAVYAYTDGALSDVNYANPALGNTTLSAVLAKYPSYHVGAFGLEGPAYPFLRGFTDDLDTFSPDRVLADYPEPPLPTSQRTILGVYPTDYASLSGVPVVKTTANRFWASTARTAGAEYLEIDLGHAQAVNYIELDLLRKPVSLTIDYDNLDLYPQRRWVSATPTPGKPFPMAVSLDAAAIVPWAHLTLNFSTATGSLPFTRFLRLGFTRQTGQYLFDPTTGLTKPWTIAVQNVRVGRLSDGS